MRAKPASLKRIASTMRVNRSCKSRSLWSKRPHALSNTGYGTSAPQNGSCRAATCRACSVAACEHMTDGLYKSKR
eukprot:1194871-Prorocentrum_minimum.AAC.8